jgi:sulfopyruvate decarboxylase TPP-binding subunit
MEVVVVSASTASLTARNVVDTLADCGITHVVWLPDTESGFLYETLRDESRLKLVPVCREGETVAVAAGLLVAGQKPVIIIQSTGLYEAGDSVRGMAIDYKLPLLFVIGYRGYEGGRPSKDSAATFLEPILDAWGIPYYLIDSNAGLDLLRTGYQRAQSESRPVAVLVGREYEE